MTQTPLLLKNKPLLIAGGLLAVFFGLAYAISLIPVQIYDDWYVYRGAARAIVFGEPLYQNKFLFSYYYNPPWLALLLIPFSLFPFQFGAGLMVMTSLVCTAALCHHFKLGTLKTALVVASPMLFYILIHGQVDALTLAGILLPVSVWPLVALTKPQLGIALGLEALKKEHLKPALLLSGGIFLLSLVVFGWWPGAILSSPQPVQGPHNLWYGVWPRQLPAGIALLFFWWNRGRNDIRWLLAASPFLSPYAAAGSFLGLWIVLHTELKNWQAATLFLTAWAAVIIPYLPLLFPVE